MNLNLALAVLSGISIGAAGTVMIHVQQAKTPPPAYVIAEVEVTDRTAFQEYADKLAETMAPFEGHYHYVVRTTTAQALEGEPRKRIVVTALASAEKALGWYCSPAYRKIKPIRLGASVSRNSAPTFSERHLVANGASELLVEIFGANGRHARCAFGVAQIPFGTCVEIDLIAEVAD